MTTLTAFALATEPRFELIDKHIRARLSHSATRVRHHAIDLTLDAEEFVYATPRLDRDRRFLEFGEFEEYTNENTMPS